MNSQVKLNTLSCVCVHTLVFLEVCSGGALYPAVGKLLVLLQKKNNSSVNVSLMANQTAA